MSAPKPLTPDVSPAAVCVRCARRAATCTILASNGSRDAVCDRCADHHVARLAATVSAPKHSLAPWYWSGSSERGIAIYGDKGHTADICLAVVQSKGVDGAGAANARLIVRAVNAHEAMREALRRITEILSDLSAGRNYQDAIQKARAALALADKEE
jgi:hypothetical protein